MEAKVLERRRLPPAAIAESVAPPLAAAAAAAAAKSWLLVLVRTRRPGHQELNGELELGSAPVPAPGGDATPSEALPGRVLLPAGGGLAN
jgi:hypothetical protein